MEGKYVSLLRADSGVIDSAFLYHLEHQKMYYVIALGQNRKLQPALVEANGWWVLQDENCKPIEGIELTCFSYQAHTWSKPR